MKVSQKIRRQIYNKFNGLCAYCGCKITFKQMQIDHIIPVVTFHKYQMEYDLDDIENLNPACKYCNSDKSAFTIEDWRQFLKNRFEKRFERLYKSKTKGIIFEKLANVVPEWDGLFYFERIKE